MKRLFLLLLLTGALIGHGQKTALTESEKEKQRLYWRQHWPEKVKAEVIGINGNLASINISNTLPYDISKYHINLQWYDAKSKPITAAYRDGGKMINPPNTFEGYMKANTTQAESFPKVSGATTLKISIGFIEMHKIDMRQDHL